MNQKARDALAVAGLVLEELWFWARDVAIGFWRGRYV